MLINLDEVTADTRMMFDKLKHNIPLSRSEQYLYKFIQDIVAEFKKIVIEDDVMMAQLQRKWMPLSS